MRNGNFLLKKIFPIEITASDSNILTTVNNMFITIQGMLLEEIRIPTNWFPTNPVDTRRRFNVYKTSIQRHRRRKDVLQTLKLRHVSTGKVRGFCGFHKNPWN